jgi:hypothetical protein
MTDLRTAAQQALEAMESYRNMMFVEAGCRFKEGEAAITALRDALAQQDEPKGGGNLPPPLQAEPVQEPVAWQWLNTAHFRKNLPVNAEPGAWNPLYTRPPRREWQSLSEEEIDRWTPEIHSVIRAIETKLKEKNA